MATVVNVPRDTRFAELGEGLAITVDARRRRQAYEEALDSVRALSSKEDVTPEDFSGLASSLEAAGKGDELGNFVGLIMDRQNRLEAKRAREATVAGVRGALPPEEQGLLPEGVDPAALRELTQGVKNLRQSQETGGSKGKREKIPVFSKAGAKRDIFVPEEIVREGEAAIDEFVASTTPGFSRTQPAPTRAEPTPPSGADVRDVEALLIRKGEELTPANRARARNFTRNARDFQSDLAQDFGGKVVTDPLGRITDTTFNAKSEEIKWRLATTLADDLLFEEGMELPEAKAEARKRAEVAFNTGEWIPLRVREAGISAVREFLTQQGIRDTSPILEFISSQQSMETSREAFRRVIEIANPDASEEEINEAVKARFP